MRGSTILAGLALVLSAALLAGPVQAQTDDHLKCYRVRDPLALRGTVDLDSLQFGLDPDCRIRRARKFCVPVSKTVQSATVNRVPIVPAPVSGQELLDDYICYRIKCPSPGPPDTGVSDQFGSRTLRRFTAFELCTPANKCPAPPQSVSISTGSSGAVGAPDPLGWTLATAPIGTGGPLPRVATIISPRSGWGSCADPSAQWISAETACTNAVTGFDCPAGIYTYQLCWTQCGSSNVTFEALADDIGNVFLDNTKLTPPTLNFTAPTSFTETVSGIGPHILQVDVQNAGFSGGGGTATGMDLCGSITGSDVQFVPCPIPPKVAFLFSGAVVGANFGGLSGADAVCQTAASNAGLPGTYLAWLADDTTGSPATRFTQGTGQYVQTNGVVIANSWTDLTDGTLQNALTVTEGGADIGLGRVVLSNVQANGTLESSAGDCGDWSANVGTPNAGSSGAASSAWTTGGTTTCSSLNSLYCFEQ